VSQENTTIAVGVLGAAGRMGSAVCAAVDEASDMRLVAALDVADDLEQLVASGAEVVVDFTTPDVVMKHLDWAIERGIHAVVGTTGFTTERLDSVRQALSSRPEVGVLIAPNFSLGAVLLMRFARDAAPHFESVEVIELHHPDKLDAPSGTARHTVEMIAEARQAAGIDQSPDATAEGVAGARGATIEGVSVHSVRLRGLVAHEEVLLGNPGEVLTLRHDSLDRSSFMPGVLLGIREVRSRPGLTLGLEALLDA